MQSDIQKEFNDFMIKFTEKFREKIDQECKSRGISQKEWFVEEIRAAKLLLNDSEQRRKTHSCRLNRT